LGSGSAIGKNLNQGKARSTYLCTSQEFNAMKNLIRWISPLLFIASTYGQRNCLTYPPPTDPSAAYRAGGRFFEQVFNKLSKDSEKSFNEDNGELYYLPVVVHVLHNGEPEGTGRNLSLARIQSQLTILNQDYGRIAGSPGFNSNPVGADSRIRFCLATRDPNGNPTTGVIRVNTGIDAFDLFTQNVQLKSYSNWDPEKYLNIWVCKLLGNYIGYAQYPYIQPTMADSLPMVPNVENVQPDGVVIEYRVFGNVPPGESGPYPAYNKGRTATHEIGHYLGLLHIWGDGSSCVENKTDFCSDTPPQATYTSGCPTSVNSCIAGVPAMKENYLDYTNDACMNIFTLEQRKRMRLVLRNCIRRKTVIQNPAACGLTSIDDFNFNAFRFDLRVNSEENLLEITAEKGGITEATVLSLIGVGIKSFVSPDQTDGHVRLPIGSFATGSYFLRLKNDAGVVKTVVFRKL
jgi:hypothetical protein